jgi:hypothetical protein
MSMQIVPALCGVPSLVGRRFDSLTVAEAQTALAGMKRVNELWEARAETMEQILYAREDELGLPRTTKAEIDAGVKQILNGQVQ